MKIRKVALAAVITASLIALSGCGEEKSAPADQSKTSTTVGLVQLVEHPALDEANRGIVDAVKARGLNVDLTNKTLKLINPTSAISPSVLSLKNIP